MDLTNKSKVDFTDAHLWAQSVKFRFNCKVRYLPEFFKLIWGIKITIHPHLDETDNPDYYVHVEFVCEIMQEGATPRLLKKLIELCNNTDEAVFMYSDGWACRLGNDGTISGLRELAPEEA